MHSGLFHGIFILILFLSLSLISIILTKACALEVVLCNDPQSESWQSPELLNLAKEFRQWRSCFYPKWDGSRHSS